MGRNRSTGVSIIAVVFALVFCWWQPGRAVADGFIIIDHSHHLRHMPPRPRPPRIVYMPLSVKYHRVKAEITGAVAVTKIDQAFHNPNPRQLEGTYIFPLDDDVAVQRFTMYMNGKQVSGELLAKDKARKIYEDYVRKMKDPALLEYVGSRMFKARVFPIPANGDVRITLDYTQAIPVKGGMATYRYPLNTEKFSSKPLEEVSVHATITSDVPLSSVFCPTHPVRIDRRGPNKVIASYEDKSVKPDKDFLLYYNLSKKEFGLSLLTYRAAGEDGFFMARLAPKMPKQDKVIPKDICFVIDVSGSMSGDKIRQARKSLKFCLSNLNKGDRFNVISFSTESRPFREELTSATESNVGAATRYVDELKAIGGTNINDALIDALKMAGGDSKRPYLIVFMTDGKPTIGVTDVKNILSNIGKANKQKVRIFVLGVGSGVNTRLLDRLADDNHGSRDYVTEKEDLEVKLSTFYTALANPVMGEPKLTFGGVTVEDVYPKQLSDLFKGSELVVFGRYSGSGVATVRLTGLAGETKMMFGFEGEFPTETSKHDFVPRLWARTKIGYLMDQIRLHGSNKELKDEVVRLSKKYGIMTELTSWLVLEDKPVRLGAAPAGLREALARPEQRMYARRSRGAFEADTGSASVGASRGINRLKSSGHAGRAMGAPVVVEDKFAGSLRDNRGRNVLRNVGAKTFYRDGERWVDSMHTMNGKVETVKIRLYSDEYFELTRKYAEAAKYLAIGPHVVVVLSSKAYETVSE